jgi:hypothetical protein
MFPDVLGVQVTPAGCRLPLDHDLMCRHHVPAAVEFARRIRTDLLDPVPVGGFVAPNTAVATGKKTLSSSCHSFRSTTRK